MQISRQRTAFAPAMDAKKDLSGVILPVKNLVLGAKTIRKTKGRFKRRYT